MKQAAVTPVMLGRSSREEVDHLNSNPPLRPGEPAPLPLPAGGAGTFECILVEGCFIRQTGQGEGKVPVAYLLFPSNENENHPTRMNS